MPTIVICSDRSKVVHNIVRRDDMYFPLCGCKVRSYHFVKPSGKANCQNCLNLRPDPTIERIRLDAYEEHVFMLHLEGLGWSEIGRKLGLGRNLSQQMHRRFAKRMRRALRFTKVTIRADQPTKVNVDKHK